MNDSSSVTFLDIWKSKPIAKENKHFKNLSLHLSPFKLRKQIKNYLCILINNKKDNISDITPGKSNYLDYLKTIRWN